MKKQIKKWISCLLTAAMIFTMVLAIVPQRAEAGSASLSGSGSLRAGDSVTLTFSVSGSGIVALQGSLSYDSDKLEFLGMDQLIGGSWGVELSGSTVLADDVKLSDPIDGSAGILEVTFRVKSNVSGGSTVSASITGVSASDGENDYDLGGAYWEAEILSPLSGNAKLSSLSCSNATLSPEFSADTTYYTTSVPYDVTSLSLSFDTEDGSAEAYVSGNELDVGSNTVTVGVEAEDGTTKYYTIEVTREQDPVYEASKDASLADIEVSTGRLSPEFSSDITDYVVYVPFEKDSIYIDGTANDGKAQGVEGQEATLTEGDNVLTVVCTAEDGVTTKTYTVHVYRMPAYKGVLPSIVSPDAQPVVQPEPAPEPEAVVEPEPTAPAQIAIPAVLTLPVIGAVSTYVVAGIVLVLLAALFCVIGLLIGRSAGRRKTRNAYSAPQDTVTPIEETPVAKIPAAEEAPAPAEKDTAPAAESIAAKTAAPVTKAPVAAKPATVQPDAEEAAEEVPAAEEPAPSAPQEVSLDELLEDIRNM